MGKNDDKIRTLLSSIELKKSNLGVKPRAAWKTNGIMKFEGGEHININTVNQIEKCVEAVAYLLQHQEFFSKAAELLGVKMNSSNDDYLHDFKLRASMIIWDMEKKKLDVLESKLKDLRSEDAKTEDALSGIMKELE